MSADKYPSIFSRQYCLYICTSLTEGIFFLRTLTPLEISIRLRNDTNGFMGKSHCGICVSVRLTLTILLLRANHCWAVIFRLTRAPLRDTFSFGTVLTWTLVFSHWKMFTTTWNQSSSRHLLQFLLYFAWFSLVHWKTCFWVSFC